MKSNHCLAIVTILLGTIWGCTGNKTDVEEDVLARVGRDYLTVSEAVEQIPQFVLRQDSAKAVASFADDWIRRRLLLQEAQRLEIARNDEVQKKLKNARQEILIKALKDFIVSDYSENITITDEEAQNYYQANKDQFILNERFVKFRHVETVDLESARAARRALSQGNPWPEVARKYCVNPEAKIKKSEQFWPISIALSELETMNRYLRRIGHTERSVIQRIGSTYHFVQLMESRAEGKHPDLEWLMKQIKEWLILDKRKRHFNSYVKNLYLKAKSNNEIDTYNVLIDNTNDKKSTSDTLDAN